MKKTKLILAVTGGAIGLVVLVLAFLVWQAFSAKSVALEGDDEEGVQGLETVESSAQTLSRKPVYPSAESLAATEANEKLVNDWGKEGLHLAARGDKVFATTTPAAFKTFLVDDAKRIAGLPGSVAGKLVKPDFAFGPFKSYIAEGKMPAEAELAELQRKWDDVATVADILSRCGVAELLDVGFVQEKKPADAQEGKKGRKNKGSGKKAEVTPLAESVSYAYSFVFAARPPALVRVINELAAAERFITVDSFGFSRATDVIATALGGDEKKDESASSAPTGRRGRRGRRGLEVAESKETDAESGVVTKNGLITDPLVDEPLKVSLTLSVHDFRSHEKKENGEEDAKSAEKGALK